MATTMFSSMDFDIDAAMIAGVVSHDLPSLTAPSRSVMEMSSLGFAGEEESACQWHTSTFPRREGRGS